MTAGRLLEAERFQRASGRRVLGCPARTPHEVVYGELGWSPVEYRRDDLRLRYFRRLVLMDEQRAVHRMFRYRKRKWDAAVLAGVSPLSRRSWCGETVAVMRKHGIGQYWAVAKWQTEELVKEQLWRATVEAGLGKSWMAEWSEGLSRKVSLELFRSLKESPSRERYLEYDVARNEEVALRVALRGGAHSLEVSRVRWGECAPPREERVCQLCSAGLPEDVDHFLLGCVALDDVRRATFRAIEARAGAEAPRGWLRRELDRESSVRLLLGAARQVPLPGGVGFMDVSEAMDLAALRGVSRMNRARERLLRGA